MYLAFGKMHKNFDQEDLEVLWGIVKARFKKTEPVNYMDNFLHINLKTMFEHHLKDNVWKNQQGLVTVLNWKLYDSCGVHCLTMQNILYYLLVEKMYPLTKHTLHQVFNDVKLQVDYECEMAFELLILVKKQLKEGYLVLLVQKLLLLVLKVNAAGIKVTTAERIKTAQRKDKDCLCDILANGKGLAHIVHGKPDTGVGADVLLLSPDGCREVERMLWFHCLGFFIVDCLHLSGRIRVGVSGDFVGYLFIIRWDLERLEVPRVLVTCRSKLKFLKTVKTIISGTDREALFRQSVWDLGVKKRK
ncbi:hypothetical protein Tco_1570594 [Tanacetum coccineum]